MQLRLALPETVTAKDPVRRANEAFDADTRADKINLGIGVYADAAGRLPLLQAVRGAEQLLHARGAAHAYLPIRGLKAYNDAVRALVLGRDSAAIAQGRALTVQALGGTGALTLAARLLKRARPDAEVLISDPTWDNHRAIFEAAGLLVRSYPYLDAAGQGVDFDALCRALRQARPGSIVLLHACCHNPTGVDLSDAQWDELLDLMAANSLLPMCDLAYQGFGAGLALDRKPLRRMEALGFEFLVASSLSKSMALYGERVGALTLVAASPQQAAVADSLLQGLVRSSYSNPPTQGAALAAEVLGSPELSALWQSELDGMRERIVGMRTQLAERLSLQVASGHGRDLSFIKRQRGMFSYTGLRPDEVAQLREHDGIHLLETGRLCIAALNPGNLDRVARAIGQVLNAPA